MSLQGTGADRWPQTALVTIATDRGTCELSVAHAERVLLPRDPKNKSQKQNPKIDDGREIKVSNSEWYSGCQRAH